MALPRPTGELMIPVVVFESKDDNKPVRHDLSWPTLAERLCNYDERSTKDGRAWSPVTYRPGTTRARDNVEEVHALVLDIDHADLPSDLLNGLEYVAHTTFSHTAEDPRWRVVLPLTRSVVAEEWPSFWLRANAYFGGCGDPQTKDRSRIFYLPSCLPGGIHETKQQHGLLLDPASLPDVPQYETQTWITKRNGQLKSVSNSALEDWSSRFAGAKLQELAYMHPNTGRNAACNRLAYLLGGLIADGRHALTEAWVEEELYNACKQNNLVFEDGERSVRATIASGLTAGLAQPWSPADQDDNRPAPTRLQIHSSASTGRADECILQFRTAREVAAAVSPDVAWIAPPWVASGVITEIDGRIKAGGKTTWASYLCRSVVSGAPFMGQNTTRTSVVYLTEQPERSFREALRRAGLLDRDDVHILFWHQTVGVQWVDVVRNAVKYADQVGAGLLIVDTLGQFAGLRGDAENNAGDALAAIQPLQEAAALHNLGVLIVRHERKSGGEVGDSARGSSAFAGAVDIVIQIQRANGFARSTIRILSSLSRFDETPDKLVINLTDDGYVALGSESAVAEQEAREAILHAAPDSPDSALTTADLLGATEGIKRTVAYTIIEQLVREGLLERLGEGKKGSPHRYYSPSAKGLAEMYSSASPIYYVNRNFEEEEAQIHSSASPPPLGARTNNSSGSSCALCGHTTAEGEPLCAGCEDEAAATW